MMMTQSQDLGIKKMEMGNSTASHTTTLDITSFSESCHCPSMSHRAHKFVVVSQSTPHFNWLETLFVWIACMAFIPGEMFQLNWKEGDSLLTRKCKFPTTKSESLLAT